MLSDFKSRLFRRRWDLPGPRWEYELPEGEIAIPAQLAEYLRRWRRLNIEQCLIILGFIPLGCVAGSGLALNSRTVRQG